MINSVSRGDWTSVITVRTEGDSQFNLAVVQQDCGEKTVKHLEKRTVLGGAKYFIQKNYSVDISGIGKVGMRKQRREIFGRLYKVKRARIYVSLFYRSSCQL